MSDSFSRRDFLSQASAAVGAVALAPTLSRTASAGQVAASTLYASVGNSNNGINDIYTINQTTGLGTLLGSTNQAGSFIADLTSDNTTTMRTKLVIMIRMDGAMDSTVTKAMICTMRSVKSPEPETSIERPLSAAPGTAVVLAFAAAVFGREADAAITLVREVPSPERSRLSLRSV